MELLIEHVRRKPMAEEFVLNYVTGEGSPEGSYRELGVEPTGEEIAGEVAMGLRVTDRSAKTIEYGPFNV